MPVRSRLRPVQGRRLLRLRRAAGLPRPWPTAIWLTHALRHHPGVVLVRLAGDAPDGELRDGGAGPDPGGGATGPGPAHAAGRPREGLVDLVADALRNPLAVLQASVEAAERTLDAGAADRGTADRVERHLRRALAQTERLAALVDGLLELARQLEGPGPSPPAPARALAEAVARRLAGLPEVNGS